MKQEATHVDRPAQFNEIYEGELYKVRRELVVGGPDGITRRSARQIARRRARAIMREDRSVPLERLVTLA